METLISNILVPTDFSAQGSNAMRVAITLCKKHNAVLHLLHVVKRSNTMAGRGIEAAPLTNELDRHRRYNLYKRFEPLLQNHSIPVQVHISAGIPSTEICKAAIEMPIDLIVLTSERKFSIKNLFSCSIAYNVIKQSIKPVLTIPTNFKGSVFENILFPVRPVNGIREKYEFLKSFLKNHKASVHIGIISQEGKEEELLRKRDDLHEIATTLKSPNLTCSRELYTCRNTATTVLRLSRRLAADLIVINSTPEYKWPQVLKRSYTHQIVNRARVPVLNFKMS